MKTSLLIKFINQDARFNLYNNGESLSYQTLGSSGFDLRANEATEISTGLKINLKEKSFNLKTKSRCLIHTGIFTEFDSDLELQIRSRSGLALKSGVFVLNSPGTIDSDYRGEIGVILFNSSEVDFEVKYSDRIAQAVLCPVAKASFIFQDELSESTRGAGGFGSTGK
jgi:dUTP pyrophosphatase